MENEQDRVRRIMRDIAEGNTVGDKLVYDKDSKTLRPASSYEDRDRTIKVTPQDMSVYSGGAPKMETELYRAQKTMEEIATGRFDAERLVWISDCRLLLPIPSRRDRGRATKVPPQDRNVRNSGAVETAAPQDRVRRIMEDIAEGKCDVGNLPGRRHRPPLRPAFSSGDRGLTIKVTPQDMEIHSSAEVSAS